MKNRKGFTLIELLVVVLIIGILAAVALPQYQKAVLKSRLVKWTAVLDTLKKNIDMYHLENDWSEPLEFTGLGGEENLTIDLPCDSKSNHYCTIDKPGADIFAHTVERDGEKFYAIIFQTDSSEFGEAPGELLLAFPKNNTTGKWSVDKEGSVPLPRMLCEWVRGFGYPGWENIVSDCALQGVTIPPYTDTMNPGTPGE